MLGIGNGIGLADIAAVTKDNDGFGSGNGALWLIIILAILFGWGRGGYGFGGFGGGTDSSYVSDNYVLTSDFSQLSRQIDNGFSEQRGQGIQIANGIASLGYDQLAQMNGINTNIMTVGNAIQSQMADCCCQTKGLIADVNYNLASQANGITNAITSGFCQTNYNNATNTRDIIDNQNMNARAILDAISANKVEALKDRIAEQNQQINALQLASSQCAQNQYLISQLGPKAPVAAYTVPNPYCNCGYNNGCGCCS